MKLITIPQVTLQSTARRLLMSLSVASSNQSTGTGWATHQGTNAYMFTLVSSHVYGTVPTGSLK